LGNVNDVGGIRAALTSPTYKYLDTRPAKLDSTCLECEFVAVCNGGCMHNAFTTGNVMGKDPFCAAYKMLYHHIRDRLNIILAETNAKQATCSEGAS
jgi:uncharacterized protein